MPTKGIYMGYFLTRLVFDREVELSQLQAPPHESRVVICELPQIGEGGVVCPYGKLSAQEVAAEMLCGPNQG
jgi:hypothetical protein